jgi:MFS family permease
MGTVKLTDGAIVYVPRPTADPQDPLNMPMWQKYVVMIMLSLCMYSSNRQRRRLTRSSSLYTRFIPHLGSGWPPWLLYTHLRCSRLWLCRHQCADELSSALHVRLQLVFKQDSLTLPRGLSNLVGIPMAIAVGRRVVFLASTVILLVGALLCATAGSSYDWHLGARCFLALAAGQSEALVPMITQVCAVQ